jgi:head-tail adaptor
MQVSRWEVRYQAGIEPKMRVSLGSRVFEIGAIFDPDQKRQTMILVCEELQNPGV